MRFVECDAEGIAFNAHYLVWADEAMTAWLVGAGTPYPSLVERGLGTRVVATALEWSGPVRWGDVVEVDVVPERLGRTSFALRFDVRAGERPSCAVRTTYVLTDRDGAPTPLPEDVRAAWSA